MSKHYTLLALVLVFLIPVALVVADGTDILDNYVAGTGAGENLETDSAGVRASGNVFVGRNAGNADTTGSANVGVGYRALPNLTTGIGNIALGYIAGESVTTGSHGLFITNRYYPTYGIFGDFATGYFGINNTTPISALDVTGAVKADSLNVLGAVNITGDIAITGGLAIVGTAGVTGDLTVSGTITGATTADIDSLTVANLKVSGASAKGIDFAAKSMVPGDPDYTWIAMGTWNDALTIRGQTDHFVPLQAHLHTRTNVAKDIAAARFRVDTDSTVTLAAIGNLQLRQSLAHNLASSAILNASVSIDDAVTVGSGSILGGYFSIEGSGAVTKAGGNDTTPLVAINNNTSDGSVDNVFRAAQNGTGTTVSEIIHVIASNGTATTGINFEETSGTITTDISLQNGETISNATDGQIAISGAFTGASILNVDVTTNTIIAATDYGKTYVFTDTGNKWTATLPTAASGGNMDFIVDVADSGLVTAADGDSLKVMVAGAWTKYKTLSAVASAFRLKATDTKWWYVTDGTINTGSTTNNTIVPY